MGKFLTKFLGKRDKIKRLKQLFKGSWRDPLLYLGIISAVLFYLIPFGSNSLSNSLQKGSFSLVSVSEIIKSAGNNSFISATEKLWSDSPELFLVEQSSVKSVSPPTTFSPRVLGALVEGADLEDTRKIIAEHIVQPGESIWSIAESYGVSVETVVWANDLKTLVVQPGQSLIILPVSGVIHLVKDGDTVSSLAQKYKANSDKILSFNDLNSDNDIFPGEVLIIPDGQLPLLSIVKPPVTPDAASLSTNNFNSQSHVYPFGQCTWWVAQKRPIPGWGNAKDWLANAENDGVAVCRGSACLPQKGAVIVLLGSRTYGHVGYVEDIKDGKVVFSEMNYISLAKMNYRTLRIGSAAIIGYIY